jgi:hypothetical protein
VSVGMGDVEASHSGLVRPPAKRVGDSYPLEGSNPSASATWPSLRPEQFGSLGHSTRDISPVSL